jgi:hypothetical protein
MSRRGGLAPEVSSKEVDDDGTKVVLTLKLENGTVSVEDFMCTALVGRVVRSGKLT